MPRAPGSLRCRRFAVPCVAAAAVLVAANAAAATVPFDIHPYLQHLDTTSVRVRFRTTDDAAATVVVNPAPKGPALRFSPPDRHRMHDVVVSGLSADTTYGYVVEVGNERSAQGSFTTAPADPSRPFSFVVYGDCRSNPGDHASVVRAIEATPSDFLLQTGDLVDRGERDASWRAFFSIEADLLRDRSLFVAIGNHDLDGMVLPARDVYLRYFGASDDAAARPYFTFRWANARFFMLDAMDRWDGSQTHWLREQLEASGREQDVLHRIVVTHHGPFSSGPHGANERFVNAGLVELLRRHQVSLVLAGHDHLYERGEVDGLKYVVTGGAGAPLYKVRERVPGSEVALSSLHFVQVQVDGPRVTLTARSPSGEVLDRCGFEGAASWRCGEAKEARTEPDSTPASVGKRQARTRCGCEAPGRRGPGNAAWVVVFAFFAVVFAKRSRGGARATTGS